MSDEMRRQEGSLPNYLLQAFFFWKFCEKLFHRLLRLQVYFGKISTASLHNYSYFQPTLLLLERGGLGRWGRTGLGCQMGSFGLLKG